MYVHGQCCWWPWAIRRTKTTASSNSANKRAASCVIMHLYGSHQLPCFLLSPCKLSRNSRSKPLLQSPLIFDTAHMWLWHILLVPTLSVLIKNRNELFDSTILRVSIIACDYPLKWGWHRKLMIFKILSLLF